MTAPTLGCSDLITVHKDSTARSLATRWPRGFYAHKRVATSPHTSLRNLSPVQRSKAFAYNWELFTCVCLHVGTYACVCVRVHGGSWGWEGRCSCGETVKPEDRREHRRHATAGRSRGKHPHPTHEDRLVNSEPSVLGVSFLCVNYRLELGCYTEHIPLTRGGLSTPPLHVVHACLRGPG